MTFALIYKDQVFTLTNLNIHGDLTVHSMDELFTALATLQGYLRN